jgi:predicted HicB family RNase H-like nuclease
VIEYKGYQGVFDFDPSLDVFHGRVVGLQDVVTFQGRSLDELRQEMAESVEDYIELCEEAGKEPERPYRGEFLVRTTPELHREATVAAEAAGMSLNAWVEAALTSVVREGRPSYGESRRAVKTAAKRKAKGKRRSAG